MHSDMESTRLGATGVFNATARHLNISAVSLFWGEWGKPSTSGILNSGEGFKSLICALDTPHPPLPHPLAPHPRPFSHPKALPPTQSPPLPVCVCVSPHRVFNKPESLDSMRRRVSEFSRWLRNRPEHVVVAFGHSTFWKYFANSTKRMRNCEVVQMWW